MVIVLSYQLITYECWYCSSSSSDIKIFNVVFMTKEKHRFHKVDFTIFYGKELVNNNVQLEQDLLSLITSIGNDTSWLVACCCCNSFCCPVVVVITTVFKSGWWKIGWLRLISPLPVTTMFSGYLWHNWVCAHIRISSYELSPCDILWFMQDSGSVMYHVIKGWYPQHIRFASENAAWPKDCISQLPATDQFKKVLQHAIPSSQHSAVSNQQHSLCHEHHHDHIVVSVASCTWVLDMTESDFFRTCLTMLHQTNNSICGGHISATKNMTACVHAPWEATVLDQV
jgi:hypothetical protein